MTIVVFGLSISSAWGNGHATLLRGLFRCLCDAGHEVHFFERDVPYYAAHRDAPELPYAQLHLYNSWEEHQGSVRKLLAKADVAMVTSYCPDGAAASELILGLDTKIRTVFYDMDTPVTLSKLAQGATVPYLPTAGLAGFDLVLSYTGGEAVHELRSKLGAQNVATLYGWVDPQVYSRTSIRSEYVSDLSYLGTYAPDRQQALDNLLFAPAARLTSKRFVIAGAMYERRENWPDNIRYFEHISPPQHSAFYSSSPMTLSTTRGTMAAMGFCPSGRLFEAAACGTAVLSDYWEGLDTFFTPGEEILIADSTDDAVSAITADRSALTQIGSRARERALDCHTAAVRARRFIELVENPPNASNMADLGDNARVQLASSKA